MPNLIIHQIPVLKDNFVYLLHDSESGESVAIDPAVATPVLDVLELKGWTLSHIWNTHHHNDHTGGNLELKQATGCSIVGSAADASRIPGIDVQIVEGDLISIGSHTAQIFEVSGHTIGHIAYWLENDHILFSGDTLFSSGCGRLFEGTPEQMWTSLLKLRNLPDDTNVYCAHEYTATNVNFALTIEPNNVALKRRLNEVLHLRKNGKPTVPSNLGDEKRFNPFLRADNVDLLRAIGLVGKDAVSVFAEIRRRKDEF
ncbi:MAG: hydroxyacylglutathione hydrolase [Magnetovibrio sp.]|nr:hydroxyacylglutathione hydrolase [Magnetovibrio sp.]|tara:strand:- start:10485 stop:11255 length:771 start_codon:yes stop_codon:yes gene_type:complete